ncbi:site-specific integrase [Microvirga flavescens]|uniref:site-specific integrase n=1 Tax=Microvirga flavescens TaxID=2249811 RepID=UPI00130076BB|nr:site-specific integrase [Microvirga flavescens]
MAHYHVTHLVRRGHVFWFRMALPHRMVLRFGRREIKLSLKTSVPGLARLRARALSAASLQLITLVQNMPELSPSQVQEIARNYLQTRLHKAEEVVLLVSHDKEIDREFEAKSALEDAGILRQDLSARRFSPSLRGEAMEALATQGLPTELAKGEGFDQLCAAILRAQIENYRIYAAKLFGQYDQSAPLDPLFAGVHALGPPPIAEDQTPSRTLKLVIERYCEIRRSDWVLKTFNENLRVLRLFMALSGKDRPIVSIQDDDVRDFRDALLRLPSNYMKRQGGTDLDIREVLKTADGKAPLAKKTATKYRSNLTTFLRWCVDEGYLTKEPGAKIKTPQISAQEAMQARESFSTEQLSSLFSSPLYRGCKSETRRSAPGHLILRDGKFWIPLVALYSGMRLGEIVQLLVSDIKVDDDIAYFDVRPGEGKTVKTASSVRKIPVHSELLRLGLMEHIQETQKKSPKGRLFPDIKPGSDGYYSHNFSKWFGRYTADIDIKSQRTTFHSFRHTFKDALVRAKVPGNIARSLMGHASESVHDQYGSAFAVDVLNEELQRVAYKIDLSGLYPAKN